MDTESLIRYGGLLLVCLVVYSTTGLFFCFFLPSGAVLFSTGVLAASGALPQNIFTVFILLFISSLAGSWTGYLLGRNIGPALYNRKDSFFFKRKHLETAEMFYKKYGRWTLIAGYFLPIIRSFTAIIAGITRMKMNKFLFGTAVGSFCWTLSFAGSGYFMGSRPQLKPWLGNITAAFICIITIPLLIKIVRSFSAKKS